MSGFLISDFDTWQPGYGGAVVSVYIGSTTTLAALFKDENMTIPALNPQTLDSRSDGSGNNYGKFSEPLYVGTAYRLNINGMEETGIIRPPFSSLDDEDASNAIVVPTGSSHEVSLADLSARQVFAQNFGLIDLGESGSAATNTDTLQLAIAALTDGGSVICPPGVIRINTLSLPEGVVLEGAGKTATTLLSIVGDVSITLTGNRSGLRSLTLDGNILTTDSVGLSSVGKDEVVLENVLIQRFETNLYLKGGSGHRWRNFDSVNAEDCVKLHGDTDAGGTSNGAALRDLIWDGGKVSVGSTTGISAKYIDALCQNINLNGVGFVDCPGTALDLIGGQFVNMNGCYWQGNEVNVNIEDDTDPLTPATELNNKVISIRFNGGRMDEGKVIATGTAQEVILDGIKLVDVEFQLDTPVENFITLVNCTEEGVTITGESTKLLRRRDSERGDGFGLTTGNAATKAWGLELQSGQIVNLIGRVIGKQRNGTGRAVYMIAVGAYRPAATLTYDTQTANFTVGDILTGSSSGATARIVADSDSGTTGTLSLTDIQGTFVDNETITGSTTGSALANGTISTSNVSLDGVGVTSLRTAYETDTNWAATFVANGPEIELQVTGATSATVEWTVSVDVVTT